ncbi:MAG TPA: hypothetical protein VHV74_04145 [Pseudonocardiaceae bacterium]|nr:hypothetical protein [Pseudonocardiaceae bacterium]
MCRADLRDRQEREAVTERLDQAVRAWLAGAPIDDGVGEPSELVSVLAIDDAVGDLSDAINQLAANHSCPERLAAGVRKGLRRDFDFVYLRFAEREPSLPNGYSDVLIRERIYFPASSSDGEKTFYGGSVARRMDGDVVVRWHQLDRWPSGWLKHGSPVGS